MFEQLFLRRKVNRDKTLRFGFVDAGDEYRYETDLPGGLFRLHVALSPDGHADTRLIEKETDEEYSLYKTDSVGAFVGEIRQQVEAVLAQVAESCCDMEVFKSP